MIDKYRPIFDTLFKTFNPEPYPVKDICQKSALFKKKW